MNKKLAMKWVKALLSGKYKQGRGRLKYKLDFGYRHCCLGVLCEVEKIKNFTELPVKGESVNRVYPGNSLKNVTGRFSNYESDLAQLNDGGYTFEKIAAIIKKKYKEL